MGAVCFLPLCRGVFIPPRPFLGPRHRNGEGSAGIRCAAGRPSWHRLSGRPVLCQHAFGRSVAAARAAAGAGAALAGTPAGRAAKSVESGTRCICGRRIPFTGHSLVCPVRFVCADGQRKKCAPCRCGRDRADAGCDVEYRECQFLCTGIPSAGHPLFHGAFFLSLSHGACVRCAFYCERNRLL